jgi:hypothetical protein
MERRTFPQASFVHDLPAAVGPLDYVVVVGSAA